MKQDGGEGGGGRWGVRVPGKATSTWLGEESPTPCNLQDTESIWNEQEVAGSLLQFFQFVSRKTWRSRAAFKKRNDEG